MKVKLVNAYGAFSLIELSIVLIIIALLTAAIIGGSMLIRNAKIRAIINEYNVWKQNVSIFYASHNRLPGDIDKIGIIGTNSGQVYSKSDFSNPYNDKRQNIDNAPFIEMYLDKISNFQPVSGAHKEDGGVPYSSILKNSYYYFYNFKEKSNEDGHYLQNAKINSTYINFRIYDDSDDILHAKAIEQFDKKIDDGLYNSGNVISRCKAGDIKVEYASYKDVIDGKRNSQYYCSDSYFNLNL